MRGCTVSGLVLVECMCEEVYSQWSGVSEMYV